MRVAAQRWSGRARRGLQRCPRPEVGRAPDRPQAGIALVIVMWLLVLLAAIGGSHAYNAHIESRLARNRLDGAAAHQAASAGVQRAILELFNPIPGGRWNFNGTPREIAIGDARVVVRMRDTAGLVDLNRAPTELLEVLADLALEGEGEAPGEGTAVPSRDALVDALLDWRDADDLKRLHGAEEREYRAAGRTYGPRNAPFENVHELRYVLGFSPERFQRIAPYVTVHSRLPGVNAKFSLPGLLEAIPGADAATLDAYGGGGASSSGESTAEATEVLSAPPIVADAISSPHMASATHVLEPALPADVNDVPLESEEASGGSGEGPLAGWSWFKSGEDGSLVASSPLESADATPEAKKAGLGGSFGPSVPSGSRVGAEIAGAESGSAQWLGDPSSSASARSSAGAARGRSSSGSPLLVEGRNEVYVVISEATVPGGATARISAVVAKSRGGRSPYWILDWSGS